MRASNEATASWRFFPLSLLLRTANLILFLSSCLQCFWYLFMV